MLDALDRGLAAAPAADRRVAVELGGGTGLYSAALAERFATLVTIDISTEMIRLVPDGPALPVQGDGSRLPLADGPLDALVLVNMFLFPAEVDRVLAADGRGGVGELPRPRDPDPPHRRRGRPGPPGPLGRRRRRAPAGAPGRSTGEADPAESSNSDCIGRD